ncbi:MAG: aldo/keto reductase [Bacteroidales bacterium]|jgi:predicted aldo/keto reductase-like oxidoreductase|nr:aldo/keto reductase [Bacteroidales bacterium]
MSKHVDRRNFLKLSATAGAVLALAPADIQARENDMKKKMPERILGKRTGIKLPVLSMGVMRADNQSVVKAAYNSGIIMFDTANGYQNGKNEEMLGEFFADKPRESFILATKAKENPADDAAGKFLEKFETSMKRLRMSYVDILYLHALDKVDSVNYPPILEAVLKLKKDGRVKYIGVSTHSNEPAVIHAAVDNGNYDVILTAYNYTQGHLDELNPAIDRAAKAGLGVVAMKTMAGGYLDKDRTQKVNTRAALKWALQNPNIHTAIPGFTSFDQLEESLDSALNLKMSKDEKKYLSMANHSLYCRGCRSCETQCSKHLPIPEMMRAYMYNYGYKSPALAREVIDELALAEDACDCAVCKVKCAAGFQVAQKVQDITRLQYVPQEFLV